MGAAQGATVGTIAKVLTAVTTQTKANLLATVGTAIAWIPSEIEAATEDEITDFLNAGQIFQADLAQGKPLAQAGQDFKDTLVSNEQTTGRQLLSDAVGELVDLLGEFKNLFG